MRALRRFLLAALLTGLVAGCQRKPSPGRSADIPAAPNTKVSAADKQSDSLKKKIKMAKEEAKEEVNAPQLRR